MLVELRESERLMTAFGEHCHALMLASLQSHALPPAAVRVRGQRQRSWFPFDAPASQSHSHASAYTDASAALTAPDAQRLSALLLSSRTVAAATKRVRSVAHEDLLPAAVRAACEALVAFMPQSRFGEGAAAADNSKKGHKQPVRFWCFLEPKEY
jgi:hypothetical protein